MNPRWIGQLGSRADEALGQTIARHVVEAVQVAEGDPRLVVGVHASALLCSIESIHGKNLTGIVLHLNHIVDSITRQMLAGQRIPGSKWLEDEEDLITHEPFGAPH